MSKDFLDMYDIVIKALEYYSTQSKNLVNELKEPNKDQQKFNDDILQLFEKDLELIPEKIQRLINDLRDKIDLEANWAELPSMIQRNEKLITSSLALYRRDLKKLQNTPKEKGLLEIKLPNIEGQIKLIDKAVGSTALNLKLPEI
jgi:polyhydroxyalkanoate synthesis regulator phasin